MTAILKLRWIVVQDIREYLIQQNIRIDIKNTDFIIDQRIRLKNDRERHRRQFEATYNQTATKPGVAPIVSTPVIVSSVPIIQAVPTRQISAPPEPPQPFLESQPSYETQMSEPSMMAFPSNSTGIRRIKDQIYECLINDQIIKFIGMLERHTQNKTFTFVEYFGDALR